MASIVDMASLWYPSIFSLFVLDQRLGSCGLGMLLRVLIIWCDNLD